MKNDTGEFLALKAPTSPLKGATFNNVYQPMTFREKQWAGTTWLRWLRENGYIKRRVTVAGEPVRYDVLIPLPRVSIVALDLTPVSADDVGDHPNNMAVTSWD